MKSIANNPDIKEGMSRDEIDAAIKRHADFEVLYDKPFEDTKKVRVAGPFTVESLSPHRSLSFGDSPESSRSARPRRPKDADAPNFEQSILDNLAKAGIQNGRRRSGSRSRPSRPTRASTSRRSASVERREHDGDAPVADRDRHRPAVRHCQLRRT